MKKLLTVLLIALSFNAAAKEVSQPKIDARCFMWGSMAGLSDSELKPFLDSARKGLIPTDRLFQMGYAGGFVKGSIVGAGGKKVVKKIAYKLYSDVCITES
ncbi:MAG TPA: hypothetical protein EYN67_11170 [Flavobacteriales bacterium]|nr:hypothetical protein [Flavobacteriales bacterium]